jgi:hypothetical protein
MTDAPSLGVGPPVLDRTVLDDLHRRLPDVAAVALTAVIEDVPAYAATLSSDMASDVRRAIEGALSAFLGLVERAAQGVDAAAPIAAGRDGAYALGRGEARAGRTMDALLAAYRVGARVSWRELSTTVVAAGTDAATLAAFAELVFAYIDELSAASVAGHTDELAASGRLRARRLEELTRALVAGEPAEVLSERAEQAAWPPPRTLTAVLLPSSRLHDTLPHLDVRTLHAAGDAVDLVGPPGTTVLLVPDVPADRGPLLRRLHGRDAVLGTTRPWTGVEASVALAVRATMLLDREQEAPLDADTHLSALVVGADPVTLAELRTRVLAPLSDLRPATAHRLTTTLRAWLLHQGRRSDVADALHVHPQTVRYRMTQVRDLYGDALERPEVVEELVVALALDPTGGESPS